MIRRLWSFLRRFEARVLIGLMLAAGALLSFLEIADDMAEGDTEAIDRRLILMLREPGDLNNPLGGKNLEEAVRDVTALGGTALVTLVTVVSGLAFLFHGRRVHALVMTGVVAAAFASSQAMKALYGRPRPELVPHEAYVYSASFPSGHSTMTAATFLALAMLIASLESKRRSKVLVYTLAVLVVVGVGFSRVYLGVHWPSDVLAGWCLGAAWALLGWIALRMMGAPARG